VLTFIFLGEALVKIIAMGFIIGQKTYMRAGWNVIDILIVITGLIEIIAIKVNLKALRVMRIIRPLRTIKASTTMRK
jgi:Ion transport protein